MTYAFSFVDGSPSTSFSLEFSRSLCGDTHSSAFLTLPSPHSAVSHACQAKAWPLEKSPLFASQQPSTPCVKSATASQPPPPTPPPLAQKHVLFRKILKGQSTPLTPPPLFRPLRLDQHRCVLQRRCGVGVSSTPKIGHISPNCPDPAGHKQDLLLEKEKTQTYSAMMALPHASITPLIPTSSLRPKSAPISSPSSARELQMVGEHVNRDEKSCGHSNYCAKRPDLLKLRCPSNEEHGESEDDECTLCAFPCVPLSDLENDVFEPSDQDDDYNFPIGIPLLPAVQPFVDASTPISSGCAPITPFVAASSHTRRAFPPPQSELPKSKVERGPSLHLSLAHSIHVGHSLNRNAPTAITEKMKQNFHRLKMNIEGPIIFAEKQEEAEQARKKPRIEQHECSKGYHKGDLAPRSPRARTTCQKAAYTLSKPVEKGEVKPAAPPTSSNKENGGCIKTIFATKPPADTLGNAKMAIGTSTNSALAFLPPFPRLDHVVDLKDGESHHLPYEVQLPGIAISAFLNLCSGTLLNSKPVLEEQEHGHKIHKCIAGHVLSKSHTAKAVCSCSLGEEQNKNQCNIPSAACQNQALQSLSAPRTLSNPASTIRFKVKIANNITQTSTIPESTACSTLLTPTVDGAHTVDIIKNQATASITALPWKANLTMRHDQSTTSPFSASTALVDCPSTPIITQIDATWGTSVPPSPRPVRTELNAASKGLNLSAKYYVGNPWPLANPDCADLAKQPFSDCALESTLAQQQQQQQQQPQQQQQHWMMYSTTTPHAPMSPDCSEQIKSMHHQSRIARAFGHSNAGAKIFPSGSCKAYACMFDDGIGRNGLTEILLEQGLPNAKRRRW